MQTDRDGVRAVKPAAYWGSIGRKLPLLITGLLTVVVLVFTVAAYRALERALRAAAGERVVKVSQRIALALADPEIRLRRDGTPLSHDSTLRQMLEGPSPAIRARAQRLLDAEKARNPAARLVELLSANGARALAAGAFSGGLGTADSTAPAIASSVIGQLHATQDSIYAEVRLPIIGSRHDTIGVMRELSLIAGDQTGPLMRALIGGNAILLLTNARGDLWTDLHRPTAGPALAHARGSEGVAIATHNPDGSRWIGALAPVPRVPWAVWVALPEAAVLAPARPLLYEVAVIALIVVVLGAIGARMVSQHIVGDVRSVTEAAEGLAAGDYSRRATVKHNDEIGRLAGSFNRMAAEIQEAALDLGNQAVELEAQQTELEESNEELRNTAAAAQAARDDAEAQRKRIAAVVSGALDCIITVDGGCTILDFNPAAERTFEYAAAEIVGRPVTDIFAADGTLDGQCGALASYLNASDHGVAGSRMQLTALRSGGTPFAVDVAINRVPIDGPPMFTCFVRDLSAEKQLEG
ncbi:MAG TPA: HAMP domain-containing protein, partial [Gemmatimonadaceae bacterium]